LSGGNASGLTNCRLNRGYAVPRYISDVNAPVLRRDMDKNNATESEKTMVYESTRETRGQRGRYLN